MSDESQIQSEKETDVKNRTDKALIQQFKMRRIWETR